MRTLWTGSISFGLVYIPIRLYSATQSHTLDLDMLHKKDMSPIRYAKICKAEDKEIAYEEIVKGFEYAKGEYVVLTDKEIRDASAARSESIDILAFVSESEIDAVYYDKPYYLEPDKGASKVYVLLREALKKSGKVGVAKFVFRNREHLVALKPAGNGLILNQLRFSDEIRKLSDLNIPDDADVGKKEMDMAVQLIEDMTEKFRPENYRDTYVETLKALLEEKAEGRMPVPAEKPKTGKVLDLMSALKASLEKQEKNQQEKNQQEGKQQEKKKTQAPANRKPAGSSAAKARAKKSSKKPASKSKKRA